MSVIQLLEKGKIVGNRSLEEENVGEINCRQKLMSPDVGIVRGRRAATLEKLPFSASIQRGRRAGPSSQSQGYGSGSSRNITCWNCGCQGHVIRDCWSKPYRGDTSIPDQTRREEQGNFNLFNLSVGGANR